jgi:carboxyl-terminal processing protease
MMNADSVRLPDSLVYKTKKLERTVYGGGGIMPDYFVPVDTTLYTDYHRNLRNKGVIIKTAVKYIDNNRDGLLKKYKKFETFNEQFQVNDENLLTEMKQLATKEGIVFNEKEYNISLSLIGTQLKALISRDVWDMNEYYRVINTINPSVVRAVEILKLGEYEKILKVNVN